MAVGRILVCQPPSLCRDGAGLLSVGVLRWLLPPEEVESEGMTITAAPIPMMTVVAKATFSFAKDAGPDLPFAEEPMAISLDVPSELEGGEDEIAYPSDFVPMKPAVEVLLHGHAYSEISTKRHVASVELRSLSDDEEDGMSRAFAVESAAKASRAPLVSARLRSVDLLPAEPVGPRPSRELLTAHPQGFDFAEYKVGPETQQLGAAPLGWELTLTGLSPRAHKRTLRIPNRAPVAWVDSSRGRGEPLEMWCDTVWIDTDRELLVLVWRGVIEVPSLGDDGVERVVVTLSSGGREPELADVARDLVRGAFEPAAELPDLDDEDISRYAAEEAALAQYELWDDAPEPSISLEAYAAASAALAEGQGDRKAVLRGLGLDEKTFLQEERAWLTKMGDAAMSGDSALALRYGELFVAAQDGLAGPREGSETASKYAVLKVDMDDADDPAALLRDREMTLPAWMRMDRRWTRRAKDDTELQAEIERHMRAYRARKEA